MRRPWAAIVAAAATIAASYSTPVTLRQLHYRLVAAVVGGYSNTISDYKRLSELTAEARRAGEFPSLADLTRGVKRPLSFTDPNNALNWLQSVYRRDRTEGQADQMWLLFEKATLQAQMSAWTQDLGLPIAALRGYSSESLEAEIFSAMGDDGRPVIVFYVGDLDPEGEDIERNFRDQAERWGIVFRSWKRLAVTPTQIQQYGLVPQPGKTTSSRAPGFVRKYGQLFQIEVEALDPADLETLVRGAIDGVWDVSAYQATMAREARDRNNLP